MLNNSTDIECFYCPLTGKIYQVPVLAEDGFFYEELAILKHIASSKTSPTTQKPMNSNLITCVLFNVMLKMFLEKNPEKKIDEYVISHTQNKDYLDKIIIMKQYDKLLLFDDFDLSQFDHNLIITLFRRASNEVLKYFIDHIINLEEPIASETNVKTYLIYYVVQYSNLEILRHLAQNDINLEIRDSRNHRPIHTACRYASLEIIKYLVDCGVDLNCEQEYSWSSIHSICYYRCHEFI